MKTGLLIALALAIVGVAAGAVSNNYLRDDQIVAAAEGANTVMEKEMPLAVESPAPAEYRKITPEEAKARMDSGEEVLILDVRTKEEYDAGHIPSAILLPNEEIGIEAPELLPDKDAQILIYCRSGRRSAEAAYKLVALGYTGVYDFGGIIDWPYETVR